MEKFAFISINDLPIEYSTKNALRECFQTFHPGKKCLSLKDAEKVLPEVAPQLPYILAHAANSMFARKVIPMDGKPSPKLTPPGAPSNAVAAGDRTPTAGERNVKEVSKRLADSGSVSDFIALRAAQLSKRK